MNTNDWFGGRQAVEQKYHTAKKFVIEYTQRSAAPNKNHYIGYNPLLRMNSTWYVEVAKMKM